MRFREAPVDAILIVGNTADGPVLARKLANVIDNGHVRYNAHWTNEKGELRGTCIIMEDQDVEVAILPDEEQKPKPKRRKKAVT